IYPVAPQSRHGILFADAFPQPVRHFPQEFVSHGMSERVVDFLEAIEIEAEDRDLSAAADAAERILQLLAKISAVWQIGERVMPGHMRDLRLSFLPLRYVFQRRDPAAFRSWPLDDARVGIALPHRFDHLGNEGLGTD